MKDFPLTIRSNEGKTTDVLYNASVYKDEKGNVLGVFAAARDVTVRKQASEVMEVSNRELEAFTYSVSHDLRAPLRAIDSFAKILSDEYSKQLDEEGKRLISVVRKNTQQMGKLIDDLLGLSRLGRVGMKSQETEMGDMVRDVFRELKVTFPDRKIEFTVLDLPTAKVDAPLFRQVWMNLISNALKFTSGKDPAKIEVGSLEGQDQIVYYIKDNGAGFNMEYANKLFQVFERLHPQEEYEGSGVGLAIVRSIISRHGGKVWADAKVGEGATFCVALPIRGETP